MLGSMNDIERLIELTGSLTKAANAVDVPISTLNSWRYRGSIPKWREVDVYKALAKASKSSPSAAQSPAAPTAPAVADVAAGAFSGAGD
jgi:hypothetical protein